VAGHVPPDLCAVDDAPAVVGDPPGQAGLVGAHPPREGTPRARRIERIVGARHAHAGRVDAARDEDPAGQARAHGRRGRGKDAPETEVGGQGGGDSQGGRVAARILEGRGQQGGVRRGGDLAGSGEAGGEQAGAGVPVQPGDEGGQGRGRDAHTPLGARVEGGESRGEPPLGAPDPQRQGRSGVRGRPSLVRHRQGAHVVDGGARALDDGQGSRLAHGGLRAGLLPSAAQALTETQLCQGGVSLVHGGGDVGARTGGAQHGGGGVDEGFDTHASTLGA